MQGYVPRILLCGDVNSFANAASSNSCRVIAGHVNNSVVFKAIGDVNSFASATDMKVELVGKISFTGAAERGEFRIFPNSADLTTYVPEDFHVFLNGEEISVDTLQEILDGAADYIVFDDDGEFIVRYNELCALNFAERFITRENLFRQARHNFYSSPNFLTLTKLIRKNNFSRLLDFDGYFAETDFCFYPELLPTVDAVAKNFDRSNLIVENFYNKIFDTAEDCRFKIYDAILIAERSPEKFIDVLIATKDLSDAVITFARKNSALESWLAANEKVFEEISVVPVVNGSWYVLKKRVPKDFCIYVVTHKDTQLSTLPDGYKIIHAGHALAKKEFGYTGDDTGENISQLNPYLNEVTALYWMWKNTSHAIIGLNHYRRFFTTKTDLVRDSNNRVFLECKAEDILSRTEAENFLRDYDIIVAENALANISVSCWQKMISGGELESFVEKIFCKHIERKQPEYLSVFEQESKSFATFPYEIFVTRRNIFDAYCEWLFSFLLDVTDEVFVKTNLEQIDNPRKYRIISFITERMLTIWLRKNHLRIKKLPVMFRDDI